MTYSIVARDPATGAFGVAVQSHYLSVGSAVPWARPGVGAVATQSMVRVAHGPEGLERMAAGATAAQALAAGLASDPSAATRQVAMVDARGGVAAHTGDGCIPHAGDVQGDGVSCQANLMTDPGVPEAMLEAYRAGSGDLGVRLLIALRAAEAAGGDLRGRQSAALLVVPAAGESWETEVSLRVEDDAEPLDELGRLLRLHGAFALASAADDSAAAGDPAGAAAGYREAAALAPESDELRFWSALGRATLGEDAAALEDLRGLEPRWHELLHRLPVTLAPMAAGLHARLTDG